MALQWNHSAANILWDTRRRFRSPSPKEVSPDEGPKAGDFNDGDRGDDGRKRRKKLDHKIHPEGVVVAPLGVEDGGFDAPADAQSDDSNDSRDDDGAAR